MKFDIAILSLAFGILAFPAMAYLDPGTGSAILSIIIGLFVSILVVVRQFWYKIRLFFTGNKTRPQDVGDENNVK
jgi:hypothetical protein